ncbi:MAG: hypothetical protein KF812_00310 [Fimbriimonadaceae bacterium]|nr:hypothetical protein [Fimbriimonadaceae bacterium]
MKGIYITLICAAVGGSAALVLHRNLTGERINSATNESSSILDDNLCETSIEVLRRLDPNVEYDRCQLTDQRGAYITVPSGDEMQAVGIIGGTDYLRIIWERGGQTSMGRSKDIGQRLSESVLKDKAMAIAETLPGWGREHEKVEMAFTTYPGEVRGLRLSFDQLRGGYRFLDRSVRSEVEIREDGKPLRVGFIYDLPQTGESSPRLSVSQAQGVVASLERKPAIEPLPILGWYETSEGSVSLGYYFSGKGSVSRSTKGGGVLVDAIGGQATLIGLSEWPYQVRRRKYMQR